MAESQMQASTSTLFVEQDVLEIEKPTAGDIYGEDDSDGAVEGGGGNIEKKNQDLEKGPSKHTSPAVLDWDGPDDPENLVYKHILTQTALSVPPSSHQHSQPSKSNGASAQQFPSCLSQRMCLHSDSGLSLQHQSPKPMDDTLCISPQPH
jgi:hypothetical protein